MSVKIKSRDLLLSINESGAEISSVKNTDGTEFIWQADKKIWGRHAPVLFPIVGKLKNNQYILDNTVYELPQHGFARDMDFFVKEKNETSCVFELASNEETKKKFPFDFILNVSYEVKDKELITTYTIQNPASDLLYFSVGAHPGFRIPLHEKEKFEDYYLEFLPGNYNVTLLQDGLLSEFKRQLPLDENNRLRLETTIFDNDALVFEDGQINAISLCRGKDPVVTMQCENWPYFGIWSKKGCDQFICLEPWHGIADKAGTSQQLADKKGIIMLEGGKQFKCSFSLTFH